MGVDDLCALAGLFHLLPEGITGSFCVKTSRLLGGLTLRRLFLDTGLDRLDRLGLVSSSSSSSAPGSCSCHALGRRVLAWEALLAAQLLLEDWAGAASSLSSSSRASQMDAVDAGLRRFVMEFNIKSRIRRGLGSSLKAAFCGVRRAFSANSSGFLINVMGTSKCTQIIKRGLAAFRSLIAKSSTSGAPSMVRRSDTTSSRLAGWLVLLSLLSNLERTSLRGSKRLAMSSTNSGVKMVPLYCCRRGRFSLRVWASSDIAMFGL